MHDPRKNEEPRLTPADRELEAALCSLTPTGTGIDRDGLMFDMGRASGHASSRRQVWAWQGTSGLLMSVLVTFIIFPLIGPPSGTGPGSDSGSGGMVKQSERPRIRAQDDSRMTIDLPHADSYLAMRQIALTQGIDALPEPKSASKQINDPGDSEDPLDNRPGIGRDRFRQRF